MVVVRAGYDCHWRGRLPLFLMGPGEFYISLSYTSSESALSGGIGLGVDAENWEIPRRASLQ